MGVCAVITPPLTGLPDRLLRELDDVVGAYTLVGSFARDYWIHDVCGMPRGADTKDVDISILVSSFTSYRARLKSLHGLRGTGLAFRVADVVVDIIPFGSDIAPGGILEPVPGVTLDVTGMAESVESGVTITAGERTLQVPTLASMIGLKLIAWDYRRDSTHKDARDLGPLLRATYHEPFEAEVWADESAGARWGYDDLLMGPYRAGRELRSTWQPSSRERLLDILSGALLPELATQIAHHYRGTAELMAEQLDALYAGLAKDATLSI